MSDVCEGKKLNISATSSAITGLDMSEDDECEDYLQFDYGEMRLAENKLCGTDLSTYRRVINFSSFLAYFWTDDKTNNGRFCFSVSCTNIPIDDDGSGE